MARNSTTANSGALYWFNGPDAFAQRLSLDVKELDETAASVVSDVGEYAVERMTDIVQSGGINKTKKGGARIKDGDMIDSIDSNMRVTNKGRAQGEFGFINNPTDYTLFQEQGTISAGRNKAMVGPRQKNVSSTGIPAMLAFASAQQDAIVYMENKVQATQWFPHSTL